MFDVLVAFGRIEKCKCWIQTCIIHNYIATDTTYQH